jgi:hypothetical protein
MDAEAGALEQRTSRVSRIRIDRASRSGDAESCARPQGAGLAQLVH